MNQDVLLLGAGYWGKNLARNFRDLGALRVICDPSVETLARFEAGYEEVEKTTNIDEALRHPEVRRVAIAVPAVAHYEVAKKALERGLDVFVEKPLCLNMEDAKELTELAESRGQTLMVGHLLHYHPYIQKVKEMVNGGELGRLFNITSNRLNLGKIRQEENSLWSFAPHDISVILSLVGDTVPDSLRCDGGSYVSPGIADYTLTTMNFPADVKADIRVSWLNPFKEQKLTIVGSQGMLVFDDTKAWDEKLVHYRGYLSWHEGRTPVVNKSDGEKVVVEEKEPLKEECRHFLECSADKKVPRTDGREGIRVLQVLKAAQNSLDRRGELVRPEKVPFADQGARIHPTAIVDQGADLGRGTKIWHWAHVSGKVEIAESCVLGQNVFVADNVKIGRNCKIQNNVSLFDGVVLEDDVFCGPSMVFTNVYNPRSAVNRRDEFRSTLVRKGATLGANCTIVCGTTLGEYAFVAAGAVVTRDVKPYALVAGVPAKQIGWMSQYGDRIELPLSGTGSYVCPNTGDVYTLDGEDLSIQPTVK